MKVHALDIGIIPPWFLSVFFIGLWVSREGAKVTLALTTVFIKFNGYDPLEKARGGPKSL